MGTVHIRRILVPVDFSPCSERALDLACALAGQLGASVTALHAVHLPTPVVAYAGDVMADLGQLTAYADTAAGEELERFVAEAEAPGGVRAVHRVGEPVRVILTEAREMGADLIVMGTHGRRGFSRLFMGSVVDRVLRVSPVPVLSCRYDPEHPGWSLLEEELLGEASGKPEGGD